MIKGNKKQAILAITLETSLDELEKTAERLKQREWSSVDYMELKMYYIARKQGIKEQGKLNRGKFNPQGQGEIV